MSLIVESGTISGPVSNGGTAVITLPAGTDPKFLFLQALGATAEGNAHAAKGVGCATKDGGTIQQFAQYYGTDDAAGTSSLASALRNDMCLRVATGGSVVLAASIAAAGDWTDTAITVTFATTISGLTVQYLVLGGSDLSAVCGTATLPAASATTDIATPSAWGRPTAVLLLPVFAANINLSNATAACVGFGVNHQDGRKGAVALGETGGSNTMALAGVGGDRGIYVLSSGAAISGFGSLDTTIANWPTDGFRISIADQFATAHQCGWVAFRGVAIACGNTDARTTTGTTTVACGFAPKVVMWGHVGSAGADDTLDATGALLGQWATGWKKLIATTNDQANYAGSDDGQGTSFAWTKTGTDGDLETRTQPTLAANGSALDGFATLSANGNNVDMAWATDAASIAANMAWIAFGDFTSLASPSRTSRNQLLRR